MKKLLYGALFTAFIGASIVALRDHVVDLWAAPKEVKDLKASDEKQQKTLDSVVDLLKEQRADTEAQKQVTAVQVQALQSQLELIAELKRRRK